MNVRTMLIKPVKEQINNPKAITAMNPRIIIGADTQDGFVKMSIVTWKQLEFFIDILSTVDFTCFEDEVDIILKKYKGVFDEQSLQQTVAGASQSEMVSAKSGSKRKNKKAGSLRVVFENSSSEEATGASS